MWEEKRKGGVHVKFPWGNDRLRRYERDSVWRPPLTTLRGEGERDSVGK